MKKKLLLLLVFTLLATFAVPASGFAHTARNGVAWNVEADDIIRHARGFLGTRYVFGAKYGRTDMFDCSSFVKYVYRNYITLPRVSRDQAKSGQFVSKSNLRKGDLVFFYTDKRGVVGHVGVYTGNGQMIHSTPAGGVKYSSVFTGYWKDRYITARRVLQ